MNIINLKVIDILIIINIINVHQEVDAKRDINRFKSMFANHRK